MKRPAQRPPLSTRALRLPEADASVWALVARMRQGLPMSLAEYLTIAEGLAFPEAPGLLRAVAEALRAANAQHLLFGAFAAGALTGRPRATRALDFIVASADIKPFLAALDDRFGPLEIEHHRSLERVRQPAIDIIVADATKLRRAALDPALAQTADLDGVPVRLPVPELETVLKYAAAVSLTRSAEDTAQDLADLRRIVTRHPDLDLPLLQRLAAHLRFRSPKEIVQIIDTMRAGGGIVVTKRGSLAKVVFVAP